MAGGVKPAEILYEAGAHFVLLRTDKSPLWKGWPEHPAVPEVAEAHRQEDRPVGVIPSSIDALAVDVDAGSPACVWWNVGTPMVALPTRRGVHGYFDAPGGFNKRRFALGGARGDLLQGPRCYVMLHGDGLERLADAVTCRKPAPLQLEAFEVRKEAATLTPAADVPTARESRSQVAGQVVEKLPVLETVRKGARNNSLFDAVRFWAYGQHRGESLRAWVARCESRAGADNLRFPAPLRDTEAIGVGYSVGTWTWNRGILDRSPEAQRRRALKRWHGHGGQVTLDWMAERNRRIRAAVAAGRSCRDVAADHELTPRRVRQITRPEMPISCSGGGVGFMCIP